MSVIQISDKQFDVFYHCLHTFDDFILCHWNRRRKKRRFFTKDFFEGVYYKAFNCCYWSSSWANECAFLSYACTYEFLDVIRDSCNRNIFYDFILDVRKHYTKYLL